MGQKKILVLAVVLAQWQNHFFCLIDSFLFAFETFLFQLMKQAHLSHHMTQFSNISLFQPRKKLYWPTLVTTHTLFLLDVFYIWSQKGIQIGHFYVGILKEPKLAEIYNF